LDFSAAAPLFGATTEVRDRFWMKRYGPSRRRAQNATAALKIFIRHPKKTFVTISVISGHCIGLGAFVSPSGALVAYDPVVSGDT
jgi:hypothetical protein